MKSLANQTAAPVPKKNNAHFYASPNDKDSRSALEKAAEFLIPAGGLIVIGDLVYFVWFRATGGMARKDFTFVPIGLITHLIINKLFND